MPSKTETDPFNALLKRKFSGSEIVRALLACVRDRETFTEESLPEALASADEDEIYDTIAGPAVDELESHLHEQRGAEFDDGESEEENG